MDKDFTHWNKLKAHLNQSSNLPTFQEREIWWCSIGVNVGHEMDGKSSLYSRPVLVIRKFNQHIFYGVPLTTQIKENPYYLGIHFQEREQCVLLSQMRLWESKRLTRRMGKLALEEFSKVRNALRALF